MRDIYGISTEIGGAWQLDGAVLTIEGGEELVITTAAIDYQRAATKYSPLNSNKKFMITGEANGQVRLGMVIGPSPTIVDFLQRYADTCRIRENNLMISPVGTRFCESGSNLNRSALKFKCSGVLLSNLNISVTQLGQNLTVVNAGMILSIVGLEILGGQGTTQLNADATVANAAANIQQFN
jgi:hypothetical protein